MIRRLVQPTDAAEQAVADLVTTSEAAHARAVRAIRAAPHRGVPHPHPRRLPPGSGAARRARLRDHRLRGRALALAHRTPHQAGALVDVAGIVRSFQYAAQAALATTPSATGCRTRCSMPSSCAAAPGSRGSPSVPDRLPGRGRRRALRARRRRGSPCPAHRLRARQGALRGALRPEPPPGLGGHPPPRDRRPTRRPPPWRTPRDRRRLAGGRAALPPRLEPGCGAGVLGRVGHVERGGSRDGAGRARRAGDTRSTWSPPPPPSPGWPPPSTCSATMWTTRPWPCWRR